MDETTEPGLRESVWAAPPAAPVPSRAVNGEQADGHAPEWNGEVWTPLDELDALTIVARAQDGDVEAFEWLLNAYQGGLFRLCLRMLDDRTEAEDLVQETFISAWRALPELSVPQAFIPWLYRTATNKCLDMLRTRKRRPAGDNVPAREPADWAGAGTANAARASIETGAGADPAKEYESQAQMRALSDLLQTIPPGPRACWLLREVHEFSYREISAIVQLPESTVRGRIARAKRFLAEGMEPWR